MQLRGWPHIHMKVVHRDMHACMAYCIIICARLMIAQCAVHACAYMCMCTLSQAQLAGTAGRHALVLSRLHVCVACCRAWANAFLVYGGGVTPNCYGAAVSMYGLAVRVYVTSSCKQAHALHVPVACFDQPSRSHAICHAGVMGNTARLTRAAHAAVLFFGPVWW